MANKPQHLLDGYKVLDFTHFVAGPTTTRLMAGMAPKSSRLRSLRTATARANSTTSATNGALSSSSKTGARKAFVSICTDGKASI